MLGSNHAAGSRVSTRGQHDNYYSPQANSIANRITITTAGPQQSVHSDNNGIFGSITHLVRGGNTTFTCHPAEPPLRT